MTTRSPLRFRLPGRTQPLGAWLAQLFPDLDRGSRRACIEAGRVRVDGQSQDRSNVVCPPGARVEIDGLSFAGELDVHEANRWTAIVDRPPWPSGTLDLDADSSVEFSVIEAHADCARLLLCGGRCSGAELRRALARIDLPVVGDLDHGGLGAPGGPRLEVHDEGADLGPAAWPEEIAWRWSFDRESAAPEGDAFAGRLAVSDETARAIAKGHPWILPDAASDPATRYAPGSQVQVTTRKGRMLGWAHVEASSRIAARLWARGDVERRTLDSVESRVARALARRSEFLVEVGTSGTDAYRLIHGEGDGLPGVYVDRLGSLLRVLVSGWASLGFRERLIDALVRQLPYTPEGQAVSVLELLHLRSSAGRNVDRVRFVLGDVERLRENGHDVDASRLVVHERGLRFGVDPGWETPRRPRPGFGLFLDQRENRERVASLAPGGRWLNLFAHTGAFSVALLAAGAREVVSVDLSAAYLARLESNLALNIDRGVDPARHRSLKGEARHALDQVLPERFDGIVVDPPTAAAAGRRFWSVKDDLEPLLRSAIARLEAGGSLLVTQNRAGGPLAIDQALDRVARRAHRVIDRLEPAPAGSDHPTLAGFPEGEPFEGYLVTLG